MAGKTATLPATAVEPELREALARIAADEDVSLGHVIRRACEAYVQARKPNAPAPVVFVAADQPQREPTSKNCPHPKARVIKGFCGNCGTNVGTNGGKR